VVGLSPVSCAKTAEPIEMQFGIFSWVGLGNHVLDGGADAHTGNGYFWTAVDNAPIHGVISLKTHILGA